MIRVIAMKKGTMGRWKKLPLAEKLKRKVITHPKFVPIFSAIHQAAKNYLTEGADKARKSKMDRLRCIAGFSPAFPLSKLMKADKEPEYDPEQLKMGTEHEKEHTYDIKDPVKAKAVAEKTAKDHLREHPKYYTYLKAMEKQMTEDEKKG